MTAGGILGGGGGYKYESPVMRSLGKITPESYDYRDQSKLMSKLVGDVSLMGGQMRKMQKGVDAANQNFIQQLQSLINDILVLIGGGGDTGLDFGDLKYILQAIGALFGFGDGILPINLFSAAWHFFSNYILPGGNFTEVINMIIDNFIATVLDLFGEVPIVGEALQQLAAIITDIRDLLLPISDALTEFFTIFDIDFTDGTGGITDFFGPFKPIMDAVFDALDIVDLPDISEIVRTFLQLGAPLVNLIAGVIKAVALFIKMLTGNATAGDFESALDTIFTIADPVDGGSLGIVDVGTGIIQMFLNPTGLLTTIEGLASAIGLDFSSPVAFITSLVPQLSSFLGLDFGNLLDFNSPLNALNIFNLGNLFGVLPIGQLGNVSENLLDNSDFRDAISLEGGGIWVYDSVTGKTVPGSASVDAASVLRLLRSNAIKVAEDDELELGVSAKWSGLTYTGIEPIKLQLVELIYNSVTEEFAIGDTVDVAVITSPTTNQTTWVDLYNNAYVVPAGITHICLQLCVGGNATAGTIKFDDGIVKKTGTIKTSWIPGLDIIMTMVNQIMDIVRGFAIVPINDAISGFQGFVNGLFTRFGSNEGNHQGLLDQLFGGFLQIPGAGVGAGDVGNAAGTTSITASTAMELSEWVSAIQGLRNNTDLMEGVDDTEEANFKLDKVWNNTGTEPAAVFAATAAAVPVAYKNFTQDAKKGFISFFAKTSDATNFVIDVYRANPTTSVWEGPIYTSPNLFSQLDATWRYVVHNISLLANRIDVSSGMKIGIAYRVIGTGTVSIAGEPYNQPAHATIHPKRPVSVRTGSGNLAFGSTAYTPTVIPWFGMGIIVGDTPPPFYAPRSMQYTTPGDGVYTIPPEFRVAGNIIDCVACGSGSGGYDSFGWLPGAAGNNGHWAGVSKVYGTDIPLGTATLNYHVAYGGTRSGNAGQASTITGTGVTTVSAPGGTADTGSGDGPGNFTLAGKTYIGGSGDGDSPGSGGEGAIPWFQGGNGGNGTVAFRARQP